MLHKSNIINDALINEKKYYQYLTFLGQLTVPYGIECSAFLSIGEGADPSWPDIALSMTASHPGIDNGLQIASLLGLKRRVSIIIT